MCIGSSAGQQDVCVSSADTILLACLLLWIWCKYSDKKRVSADVHRVPKDVTTNLWRQSFIDFRNCFTTK